MLEPQVLDGFTHSMSQLLLPNSYRAAVLAQMEVIRMAGNYQMKMWAVPSPASPTPASAAPIVGVVPAYGQIEQQLQIDAGSYIYGWMFTATAIVDGENVGNAGNFHILVTDACTETALSSDYILASLLNESTTNNTAVVRGPCLLAQPRLISDPGLVNVEIYNNSDIPQSAQLVLFCASPRVGPPPYALDAGNPGFHPSPPARSGRPQY